MGVEGRGRGAGGCRGLLIWGLPPRRRRRRWRGAGRSWRSSVGLEETRSPTGMEERRSAAAATGLEGGDWMDRVVL